MGRQQVHSHSSGLKNIDGDTWKCLTAERQKKKNMKPNCFTLMNYPVDPVLDRMLVACITSGIKSISQSSYQLNISFFNGVDAEFWDGNKWYAWLSDGRISNYEYNNSRPKKKTMRKLRKAMMDYYLLSK